MPFTTRLLALLLLLAAPLGSAHAQAPVPPPTWSSRDAEQLLSYVEAIGQEGLDPVDYDPPRLRRALAEGGGALDRVATETFLHLATDLRQGHVRGARRIGWHIPDPPIDPVGQRALLAEALASHKVRERLDGLLPRHSEYLALKAALAATPPADREAIERLRANLERWRWMPAELGRRYLLVNVAAMELHVVDNGVVAARHKIIVGKPATPTPQFSTVATGLILNPTWTVPQSIIAESVGRLVRTKPAVARARGYVWSRTASGGLRVIQLPGPGNSLGQMKLVMPNPFTVYIHDTPTKNLFDESVRAFSHGCIRVQDPFALAATLLAGKPEWNRAAIDRVAAGRALTRASFEPVPVYVTYFTAGTNASGAVEVQADLYGRDEEVVAALTDAEPEEG